MFERGPVCLTRGPKFVSLLGQGVCRTEVGGNRKRWFWWTVPQDLLNVWVHGVFPASRVVVVRTVTWVFNGILSRGRGE